MAAADYSSGFLALKQYTFVRGVLRFLVPLYEVASGELLSMVSISREWTASGRKRLRALGRLQTPVLCVAGALFAIVRSAG